MRKRAFTLIEVVVVVGIMAIVSSLMLANFPRFNKQIAVNREAGKRALALRKAQSDALAVREFDPGNPLLKDDPFCLTPPVRFPGYGLFIDLADKAHYFIYGDIDCSKDHVSGLAEEEIVETANFEGRVLISDIIGFSPGLCGGGCSDLTEASVLYVRPGPAIFIRSGGADYNYVEIIVSSS